MERRVIDVFYNPLSGYYDYEEILYFQRKVRELQGSKLILTNAALENIVVQYDQTKTEKNLDKVLDDIVKEVNISLDNPPEFVGIGGGDGSIGLITTLYINEYNKRVRERRINPDETPLPKFVVFPKGTMNIISKSLGAGAWFYNTTIGNLVTGLRKIESLDYVRKAVNYVSHAAHVVQEWLGKKAGGIARKCDLLFLEKVREPFSNLSKNYLSEGIFTTQATRTLNKFIKGYKRGELDIRERNLLNVNGEYCGVFGAGGISALMTTYYCVDKDKITNHPLQNLAFKKPPMTASLLTFLKGFHAAVFSDSKYRREWFGTFEPKIEIDGYEYKPNYDRGLLHSFIISAFKHLPLGMRPFYRAYDTAAYEEPYKAHYFMVGTTPLQTVLQLPRLWTGMPLRDEHISDNLAHSVSITNDREFVVQMDGEFRKYREITLRVEKYEFVHF